LHENPKLDCSGPKTRLFVSVSQTDRDNDGRDQKPKTQQLIDRQLDATNRSPRRCVARAVETAFDHHADRTQDRRSQHRDRRLRLEAEFSHVVLTSAAIVHGSISFTVATACLNPGPSTCRREQPLRRWYRDAVVSHLPVTLDVDISLTRCRFDDVAEVGSTVGSATCRAAEGGEWVFRKLPTELGEARRK
jgi:hypothetical protein